MEAKVLSFQRRLIQLRERYDYPMSEIYNMDETPLTFDLPSDWTIDYAGKKDRKIKTNGAGKKRCSVVAAVTADGGKLPLNVIFRGKRKLGPSVMTPGCKFPVWVQPSAWNDEAGCIKWGRDTFPVRDDNSRRLLVWDSANFHLCDDIKQFLAERNVDML
ncbi:POGK [Branchiostoma lanceolatum]|uniref:POGK protein n=1 Tax=Branchiostoma lanceolatum TaxID=7740 RepID=A0A8J9VK13_BRALA|nr:POGK [Branchiostoma lanceolatum]